MNPEMDQNPLTLSESEAPARKGHQQTKEWKWQRTLHQKSFPSYLFSCKILSVTHLLHGSWACSACSTIPPSTASERDEMQARAACRGFLYLQASYFNFYPVLIHVFLPSNLPPISCCFMNTLCTRFFPVFCIICLFYLPRSPGPSVCWDSALVKSRNVVHSPFTFLEFSRGYFAVFLQISSPTFASGF